MRREPCLEIEEPAESCARENGALRISNHSARISKARQMMGSQLTLGAPPLPGGELGAGCRGE
jgi:hypothetical protein